MLSTLIVLSPSPLFPQYPRLVLWVIGLLSAYQVSRLIICHVTLDPYPVLFVAMAPLPLMCAAMWGALGSAVQSDVRWVWAYLAFIAALYVHFIYVTINQITHYLGIHCLSIKPRIIQSTSGPVAEPH